MESEEKRKVICITLGINETKVLKFLKEHYKEEKNGYVNYFYLHINMHSNPSLVYHSCMSELLSRLRRKNLIEIYKNNIRITEKGKLILEVIKK